ncbi:transglutaminase-like domain-containing protein [Marinobacterium jannaschii]|uniref:transglutaminase-like domain-containing protein n=1 Tax=Marinobacterium jannaschii TaxID=64970 RepID=UPI0004814DEA|nr:transglutaminase family protein [Marinobacterium jannaschii]
MQAYLEASEFIDWQHPDIRAKAAELAQGSEDKTEIARACFLFVRDQIKHSWDYRLSPTTCKASEVLQRGHGFCYAKSHLLAALLRANGIPAALCYQRLSCSDDSRQFCLHGLNAVYLEPWGWYRIDPRGNKEGVNSAFCPPQEKLAYIAETEGEADLPLRHPAPLPEVTDALEQHSTAEEVGRHLPDIRPVLLTRSHLR